MHPSFEAEVLLEQALEGIIVENTPIPLNTLNGANIIGAFKLLYALPKTINGACQIATSTFSQVAHRHRA
jgi:hypothetical protein